MCRFCNLIFVVILSFGLLSSCDEASQSANNDRGKLGEACTADGLCFEGLTCIADQCEKASACGDVAFGKSCDKDDDCRTCYCSTSEAVPICTLPCETDEICENLAYGACCAEKGFCRIPRACQKSDSEEDGDEPENETPVEPVCTPGQLQCKDWRTLERCYEWEETNAWEFYRDCPRFSYCENGECVSEHECEIGNFRCHDNTLERCVTPGIWSFYRDCTFDGGACVENECRYEDDPECTACTDDDDCSEPLEYCLIHDEQTGQGCCALFCDLGGSCPACNGCDRGRCVELEGCCQSDAQCNSDAYCARYRANDYGRCIPYCTNIGRFCEVGSRCDEQEESPTYGHCISRGYDTCTHDMGCSDQHQYCEIAHGQMEGLCLPCCSESNPCPGNLQCEDCRCVEGDDCNNCDNRCEPPYVCDRLYCECTLACPPCPDGYYCDAFTAPNCVAGECENPLFCGLGLRQCCPGFTCIPVIEGLWGFCQ